VPSPDGLATILSSFGPKETMDRLEAEIKARGMTVFAHIDHAAGAAEAGLPLRPTELLIFGSAKAGTPLIQANQEIFFLIQIIHNFRDSLHHRPRISRRSRIKQRNIFQRQPHSPRSPHRWRGRKYFPPIF
jgi:hypothetical protein